MQLLFEQLFGGEGQTQTLVDLLDYTPESKDAAYIEDIVNGVRSHAEQIDSEIASCLRGWTLGRLSRVDRAILRLSVYEMRYLNLPTAISINEAVELARKYSGEEACPFINGVLGTISRKSAVQA